MPRIFTGPGVPVYLSKPTPESRDSPSKRRKVVQQRNEAKQEQWLDADRIPSYAAMKGSIVEHLCETYPGITVLLHKSNVLLYCLHGHDDLDIAVNISMTMRILPDMTVRVFINGQKLRPNELNWALSHTNGIVQHWSQIDNLLSRYSSDVVEISNATKCKIGAENDKQQHTLKFIAEQLSLTFTASNGRRYTTDMLILAFTSTWFHKSSACYQIIQRHLALPSVRMLRDVASYLNMGANNTTFKYLRNKVNYLNPTELLVTLQLDEIHVKPKVSYQSGQLYGNASNRDQKQANRIQVFMISSVLSSNKDVVSLVPVQKMTAQDLCSMTQEVIKTVTAAGYNIVAILSDNNVLCNNNDHANLIQQMHDDIILY